MERHSRDRDSTSESRDGREQMPPPNPRRTSTEPADDKGMHNTILPQDYSSGGGEKKISRSRTILIILIM